MQHTNHHEDKPCAACIEMGKQMAQDDALIKKHKIQFDIAVEKEIDAWLAEEDTMRVKENRFPKEVFFHQATVAYGGAHPIALNAREAGLKAIRVLEYPPQNPIPVLVNN